MDQEKGGSPLDSWFVSITKEGNTHMKLDGYLGHLDLGIDPESGEENILVKSARGFFKLPEDEQYRAWAVVKVASEILERPAITIYQHAYTGELPSKVIKRTPLIDTG
jgi:hypothetical protein